MSDLKEWRHIANHSTSGDMVWNILMDWQKSEDALRKQLDEWEEKEAACCPEDFGFEEVIKSLRTQLDESNRKLEQRIAMEIDEHLKVVSLQAKLDIAVEALLKYRASGTNSWADEALKRLEG